MKKHNLRTLAKLKGNQKVNMLTCYDYQNAQLLDETNLDMILVGDSAGNVVLGYDSTVSVELDEMILFGKAVTRGATNKFTVLDMPFGTYNTIEEGLTNATKLFKQTNAQAIKLEGAFPYQLELITRLTQIGIPVMGHIGLRPQSVNQQGGYFTHGKNNDDANRLMKEAKDLEQAGAFSLVLECVESSLSEAITKELSILTIGIGSGDKTDGQVLVLNDLLKNGKNTPPSFCEPVCDLYQIKKDAITRYLEK